VVQLLGAMTRQNDLFDSYMSLHPAIQTHAIMAGASGRANAGMSWRALTYRERISFGDSGTYGVGLMTANLAIIAAGYILISVLLLWRAQRYLRRNALH
jgi:hypothetical protein